MGRQLGKDVWKTNFRIFSTIKSNWEINIQPGCINKVDPDFIIDNYIRLSRFKNL